jgi:two-component system, sensor histidine kinase PdtaS
MSFINDIFTPPKLRTSDYIQEAKYILAYRLSLFLALTIGLLIIVLLPTISMTTAGICIVALATIVCSLFIIRRKGIYLTPTLVYNLIGGLCAQYSLYFNDQNPHIAGLLWICINTLFAFLVLGQRWGMLFGSVHAFSCLVFYSLFLNREIMIMKEMTPAESYGTGLNVFLCFMIIIYLCWQNIRTNDLAKKQLNLAQDALQDQYNIISKQNEEKTVMLKEIHHRVKNNLQIITSLLRLQSRELENPEAIAKFKDATHRVIAMSMIHEKMYQSDHLSTLHMREYLHDLSSDLVTSYQSGYPVRLNIECDVESVGLRSIVPLALILNELISNSLKYAFDEYDNCLISISFMRYDGDSCRLTYIDSGTWKTPSRKDSFGLNLIDSLTDQLEGTMTTETFPQTKFELIFSSQQD